MCDLDKHKLVYTYQEKGYPDEEWVWEEMAMAVMFRSEDLNVGFDNGQLVVSVCANDLFVPAADSEDIANETELLALAKEWEKYGRNGVVRWLCRKRNQRPRGVAVNRLMAEGAWDDEMESLPS